MKFNRYVNFFPGNLSGILLALILALLPLGLPAQNVSPTPISGYSSPYNQNYNAYNQGYNNQSYNPYNQGYSNNNQYNSGFGSSSSMGGFGSSSSMGGFGSSGSSFGSDTGNGLYGNRGKSSTSRSDRYNRNKTSSSSSSSKSSTSKNNTKTTVPGKAGPVPGEKTTIRTSAPRGGMGYKSSGGPSKGLTAPEEFQMQVDTSAAVVYIDPPDQTVARGRTFLTRIMISNPSGKDFDEVRLALRYDRDVVRPVSYKDKSIRPYLAGPSTLEVFPSSNVLLYSARLKTPFSQVTDPLFEIRWEATQLTNRASFAFLPSFKDKPDGIWMGGVTDVLGSPDDPTDGVINGSVQILPPDIYEQAQQQRARGNPDVAIDDLSISDLPARVGGVRLRLQGPDKPVRVGDTFAVNIILDNSADSYIDRVDVYLRYDPDVLEVLDTDQDNWMNTGVNILDGPYHNTFPFDYHIANDVFPGRGEIVYRMGITDPQKLRHRVGTLATVTFRALRPVPSTAVSFRLPERSFSPGTKLLYLEDSVLGDEANGDPGLKELALRVNN